MPGPRLAVEDETKINMAPHRTCTLVLPTKVCLVKAMVFPVVVYGCDSWTVKKAECQELMLLNCGVGKDS